MTNKNKYTKEEKKTFQIVNLRLLSLLTGIACFMFALLLGNYSLVELPKDPHTCSNVLSGTVLFLCACACFIFSIVCVFFPLSLGKRFWGVDE